MMMMAVISMIEAPSLGWNCLSVMESVPSPRLELALPSFQLISVSPPCTLFGVFDKLALKIYKWSKS